MVADFGGGGMLLVVGVLAALVERVGSGRGQVVDAAMVDGTALLMAMHHGLVGAGLWSERRGENLLDGGAPFYRCYRTADGGFVAVGALEPVFYAALLTGLGIDPATMPAQYDRSGWAATADRLGAVFVTRTRDEWAAHFAGSDACVAPVLTPREAAIDPHLRARGTFIDVAGAAQPAPAPRFGRTPASLRPADDAALVLRRFGLDAADAEALLG
jgi:alpha-methylacyl-CoA racemase